MKEKIIMALLAGILALGTVTVTACAIRDAVPVGDTETAADAETAGIADTEREVMETTADRIVECAETGAEIGVHMGEDAVAEKVDTEAQGANGFSFALTRELLRTKEDGDNFILSPYSAWLPLAALTNGAEEDVKETLFSSQGFADVDQESFNETVQLINAQILQEERRRMMEEYEMEFESPVRIANALFVDDQEQVIADFERIFTENYEGGLFSVNFADSAAAVKQINGWASEKTEGKIEKVLESIDPRTSAAIANAVYFSDGWSTVFQEEDTRDGVFYGAEGEQTVPFMNHAFSENLYYEDERMCVTSLSTNYNGNLILMLPKEGYRAEDLLAAMDQKTLDAVAGAEKYAVQLSLPRFKVKQESFDLLDGLQAIGAVIGDETYLTVLVEDGELTVSQALQSAMLEVDEKGMTAAAVTVMGLMRMAMPRELEQVELVFDKPFAFLLTMDTEDFGQQVLFGGVVNYME